MNRFVWSVCEAVHISINMPVHTSARVSMHLALVYPPGVDVMAMLRSMDSNMNGTLSLEVDN